MDMDSTTLTSQEEHDIPVLLVTVEGDRVLDVRLATEEFVGAILDMARRPNEQTSRTSDAERFQFNAKTRRGVRRKEKP